MKFLRIHFLFIGLFLWVTISHADPGDTGNGEVDLFIKKEIGGVEQAMVIRGKSTDLPVLLRLHGGPGYPYFPYLPESGKLKELESHFIMVYWEQRGTGASYSGRIRKSSMNTAQFVEDAHQVITYVKKLFGTEKVYVWGHSWGSNIGIFLAEKYPDDIIAYIGTGQSVDVFANEQLCYQYALRKTLKDHNMRGYKKLKKIDSVDYDLKDALKVRRWIYTYGGVIFSNGEERPYIDKNIVKQIWNTPQYTLSDKINIILHPYYSGKQLWDDMKAIDLFEQVPEISVPVYFCLGRHDKIVSSELAAEYFHALQAPEGKQLIWFDHSAHRPHREEPGKFFDVLVNKVLVETRGTGQ